MQSQIGTYRKSVDELTFSLELKFNVSERNRLSAHNKVQEYT